MNNLSLNNYLFFPLALFALALAIHKRKVYLAGVIAVLYLIIGEYIVLQSRSHFLGIVGSIIFLGWYAYRLSGLRRKAPFIILVMISLSLIFLGNDQIFLVSLVTPKALHEKYVKAKTQIINVKPEVRERIEKPIKPKSYEDNKIVLAERKKAAAVRASKLASSTSKPKLIIAEPEIKVAKKVSHTSSQITRAMSYVSTTISTKAIPTNITTRRGNILFRFFIWQDAALEMVRERAWWGRNWGLPQLSYSINALRCSNQHNVGFITMHNSWWCVIYRVGILGLCFIVGMIYGFIKLTQEFIRRKSIIDGLLLACILYWSIVACFTVFLELPYYAIPFWGLVGIIVKRSGR